MKGSSGLYICPTRSLQPTDLIVCKAACQQVNVVDDSLFDLQSKCRSPTRFARTVSQHRRLSVVWTELEEELLATQVTRSTLRLYTTKPRIWSARGHDVLGGNRMVEVGCCGGSQRLLARRLGADFFDDQWRQRHFQDTISTTVSTAHIRSIRLLFILRRAIWITFE